MESNCAINNESIPSKGMNFSNFVLPLPYLSGLIHILICNTKIGKILTWKNPKQLLVAQVVKKKIQ